MKSQILTLFALLILAAAQNATIPASSISDNVPGVAYIATLTSGPSEILGNIVGTSAADGKGVTFAISFSGFNDTAYTYHIHAKPVASDGNCSSTGAHLDPYHAGSASSSPSTYKCNPAEPDLCEVGDLSGKHGSINGTNGGGYSANYIDTFLSTTPNTPAFFGNLSVVVHRASDGARLKCGNFTVISGNSASSSSVGSTFTATSMVKSSSTLSMTTQTSIYVPANGNGTAYSGPVATYVPGANSASSYRGSFSFLEIAIMIILASAIVI